MIKLFFVELSRVGNSLLWVTVIFPEEGNWSRKAEQLSFDGYEGLINIAFMSYKPQQLVTLQKGVRENPLVYKGYETLEELQKGLAETLRVLLT